METVKEGSIDIKNGTMAFLRGMTDPGVLQMVAIFILAGAFAGMAKGIGAVDATVSAALGFIPGSMIYAGLFLTACIISFSVGTSVGTIAAVVPIACGIATDTGISLPFVVGIVVGGAFFGDNLSFISDTTLAVTKAMGVKMNDKFKANFLTVLPAVAITLAIYVFAGLSADITVPQMEAPQAAKLIPYILVIVLALCGIGVIKILFIGIAACACVGLATAAPGSAMGPLAADMALDAWAGIKGMISVIIVALVAGGILNIIKEAGWFDRFTEWMMGVVKTKRGAMSSVAGMVAVTNALTANNTVAIITVGGVAKLIADRYELNPRKTAGIMDMFSCLTQSLLPYGAQLLMASAFAGIAPFSIIPWLFYPFLMGICATISILRIK